VHFISVFIFAEAGLSA